VVREPVMAAVKSHFRPEFLNRLDDLILFHRLKRSNMAAIVDIQLDRLRALLKERQIDIVLTPEAKILLADRGYDPAYGARPLKRVIQKMLQDPLAEELLAGRILDHSVVTVEVKDGRLLLNGVVVAGAPIPVPDVKTVH
jgi:ATP-dependent Clp protease ATP-binding subunit ClpB